MDPSQVIIRPVVSEKTFVLAEAGKYTFRVHDKAHKTQIRQAVFRYVRRKSRADAFFGERDRAAFAGWIDFDDLYFRQRIAAKKIDAAR